MSIRFEREPRFCTKVQKQVQLLVQYTTPPDQLPDAELSWERGTTECLERKQCGANCPGEDQVLQPV